MAIGTLAVCMLAVGCGSSSSSSSSGAAAGSASTSSAGSSSSGSSSGSGTSAQVIAQAKAAVLSASHWPSTWMGPTTPTKAQKGKKIVAISCSQATACALEVAGTVEAGKAIGWTVQVVDGKGDPSVYSSAIRNAVRSGADGGFL